MSDSTNPTPVHMSTDTAARRLLERIATVGNENTLRAFTAGLINASDAATALGSPLSHAAALAAFADLCAAVHYDQHPEQHRTEGNPS